VYLPVAGPLVTRAAVATTGRRVTPLPPRRRRDAHPPRRVSIVIASIGVTLPDGKAVGALSAAFVLLTALAGPLAARFIASSSQRWRQVSR
jgi:hypothetical protein